jgi:hypothetical protein
MRVTWVHPSWRDLVIDRLAESPARRRAFLSASSLPGIELALSIAGGSSGARRLPFVRDDDDWDALGDAVHRLCADAAQDELRRVLDALATALADATRREQAELEAIAEMALGTVRRRLDREAAVIDSGLLTSWHGLAAQLREAPTAPDPGHTLAALDPIGADPADAASVRRLDDYLAALEATGLPLPVGLEGELVAFVDRVDPVAPLSPALRTTLTRIAHLHAPLDERIWALLDSDAARHFRETHGFVERAAPPPDPDTRRVWRILNDL